MSGTASAATRVSASTGPVPAQRGRHGWPHPRTPPARVERQRVVEGQRAAPHVGQLCANRARQTPKAAAKLAASSKTGGHAPA
ncbi:hypothetical protein KQH60_01370 [Mycetohabitans sp. B8]|uniref:hypothetical protein n=1 Tax=Mycetohabitans sp. B8 TaxID=2841845 RepID=UPI001F2E9490|nr:hypothetical protein [Mycetohabitans sp. B8]MCG1041284.1 hypothetical protein [Mycetohabitans sp. B8]